MPRGAMWRRLRQLDDVGPPERTAAHVEAPWPAEPSRGHRAALSALLNDAPVAALARTVGCIAALADYAFQSVLFGEQRQAVREGLRGQDPLAARPKFRRS
jgi:hypothetical protein